MSQEWKSHSYGKATENSLGGSQTERGRGGGDLRKSPEQRAVIAQLMETQIWYMPAGTAEEGPRNGAMASARISLWEKAAPDAREATPSLDAV